MIRQKLSTWNIKKRRPVSKSGFVGISCVFKIRIKLA